MSEIDRAELENTRKMVTMLEKELGEDASPQLTLRKQANSQPPTRGSRSIERLH